MYDYINGGRQVELDLLHTDKHHHGAKSECWHSIIILLLYTKEYLKDVTVKAIMSLPYPRMVQIGDSMQKHQR